MAGQSTSASWVRGMAELFASEGLDAAAMLAEAGIDVKALEAPGARVGTEKLCLLWEIAVQRSGNPAISLAQHHRPRPKSFDVVGYTMMSCANLRDALERLSRYLRILSDALTLTRSEGGGVYRLTFEMSGGRREVPRQRMEYILVTLVNFCRWIAGRDVNPRSVAIPYPAPKDVTPYRDAFCCPVGFDAAVASLAFSSEDVGEPLPTSNPALADLHERFAGEYLEHFDRDQTSYRVRELIVRRLPDGEPRRDQIARQLGMSERTLQRRLEEERSSFAVVIDETRRELAEQYLSRLKLSLGEAAYLLGFADQSSFFRACKRWFGVPPGQYRRRLQHAG